MGSWRAPFGVTRLHPSPDADSSTSRPAAEWKFATVTAATSGKSSLSNRNWVFVTPLDGDDKGAM